MYVQLGEDKMTTPYSRERRRNIERTAYDVAEKRFDWDWKKLQDVEQ